MLRLLCLMAATKFPCLHRSRFLVVVVWVLVLRQLRQVLLVLRHLVQVAVVLQLHLFYRQ
jgi:hypothetical protein